MTAERIYVAGHRGMVGSAIVRTLLAQGVPPSAIIARTHAELDLCNQQAVQDFFAMERPTQVYLAAAKVGGIHANNTYPAEFIYDNLMVQANVIHAAHTHGVQKLLFLGSSCIYPKLAPQPMAEDALLTGPLEPTNEPYAIAKIAGIKLCESYNRQYGRDYRSVMPTNLYGPGDNYHPENSHVIPALIRRFHEAKINGVPEVVIWGTGTPRREFLYVDDMAEACVFVMQLSLNTYQVHTQPMQSHINVGFGSDVTIDELAHAIGGVVGYGGKIAFDSTKLDGAPRKWMDSTCLRKFGWRPQETLLAGLQKAYADYLSVIRRP
ncbi:MAG: GDP-L-fucose synthase [Burkholderiales bacterium]|nr:GDP-L-fucose synthase [Burkholderiales bacterium]